MTLVDTHCHLSDPAFDGDREAALARAWEAGLSALVEIADAEEGWAKARTLSEDASGRVWWSAGLHPYYADRFAPGFLSRLTEALRHPRAVAVGEIGLDYYKHCAVPRAVQLETFRALARCGSEVGKPLVLHCREASAEATEAQADMLAVLGQVFLSAAHEVRGVAHCFQGTPENALRFIDLGFFIGVDAPVTYPKAQALRTLVRRVPLESLVLETDSPYLPPQERRGKRNEPAFLPSVAEAVASARGIPAAEVARATSDNAARLYRRAL